VVFAGDYRIRRVQIVQAVQNVQIVKEEKSMQVKNFEDLEIWKDARILTKAIYQLTKDVKFAKDIALRNQIRRAAVSIMSNIAEGFERGGNQEFIQFLYVAKASCGEVRSQLYVALINLMSHRKIVTMRASRSGVYRS
jgi:four helix bundle protein